MGQCLGSAFAPSMFGRNGGNKCLSVCAAVSDDKCTFHSSKFLEAALRLGWVENDPSLVLD